MKLDPHIRLRHIRCFLEAARASSLAQAAERLHITQPAVSKTLRELEQILGVDLFDRSARRIRLNQAGRVFQQHAGAAFAELGKAHRAVTGLAGDTVDLSVGILPTAATDLFPRAALDFARGHPHCLIHATTGPNWLLLSQLREGRLDLVVGRMAPAEQMTGLTFEQLYVEEVVLVARPGHPLLNVSRIESSLADYPVILPPTGAVISPTVRGFLLSIGMSNVRPLFETVSLAFGRKATQLSDAVWFISRGVVADEVARGALCILDIHHPMLTGPVGISLRQDAAPLPERDALVEQLRRVANVEPSVGERAANAAMEGAS